MTRRLLCGLLVLLAWLAPAIGQTLPCATPVPGVPQPTIGVRQMPEDVCIPDNFPGNPIQFFDDYSWRSFVAMIWPALTGQRGVPDPAKKPGNVSGPLVFDTLKQDWELFQRGGAAPSPNWNDFEPSPCPNVKVGFNDFVLASVSKFGNLGQAGVGDLVHALPAQNGTWVRYATAFNRIEFDRIVPEKLYLKKVLDKTPVAFANGALDVKSAWVDMRKIPNPERFYTRQAWLKDPATGACSSAPVTVGLVGLHIVQKTPSRPQWIWTSFEHVDNVPQSPPEPVKRQFTFNNGDGTPMPLADPNGGFPPKDWTKPVVFNVERFQKFPIHPSTRTTNAAYRKLFAGTVWENYQLALTQWPLVPNSPATPGTPPNTFPGLKPPPVSTFANTTLETWDQRTIGKGCMACHESVRRETDFLWSLQFNAFDENNPDMQLLHMNISTKPMAAKPMAIKPAAAKPAVMSIPLQKLRAILQSADK